jgi:hypothetical protein
MNPQRFARSRYAYLLAAATLAFLIPACADGPPRGTVIGKVTLDGQPVETGSIRFAAVDGKTPTAGAQIKSGEYKAEVPVGDVRIEITAPKKIGSKKEFEGAPDSGTVDVVTEAIPARYNLKSELTMTVEKGTNTKDFELKSK